MIATTLGIDCTWKAAEICGLASTSTLARRNRPPYSSARRSRTGLNWRHGPHHSAHSSTTTGTWRETSTTEGKVASVTSTTTPLGARVAAGFRGVSADRSTAPCTLSEFMHPS